MSDADNELLELQRASATQGHAAGLPHGNAAADPTTLTTFAARRQAQREAWGQFVAIEPIHVGNALAFSVGSAVPLEHVIKYDLEAQELVARVATPEQARAGKTFGSEDEFRKANPHVKSRQRQAPELHPVALDPRGGAAHLDTDGKHGPVNEPSYEEKPKASGSKGADGKDTDAKSAAGKASA
jgi:hypothetical protein